MSDSDSFYERVWQVVAEIPRGSVTTYGDIAEYVGTRAAARTVGWAMNAAVGSGLPCHRVVNRNGELTGARFFETPTVMEERLRAEDVRFLDDGIVDMDRHRWTPTEHLPPARDFLNDGLESA
ncbi:MGMT family protein [Longibacter sp.]|jgi:O-6-methylguanine DNA methyltransferase|uniref:MGMT family protein n=1 Tax=Longibacter sp. TaxID=2045415 RepID=UPI003EC02CF5